MLCAVGIAWGEEEPKAARVGVAGLTAGKAFDHRRGDLSDSDETDAGHLLLLESLSARLGVCSSDRIVSSTSEGLVEQGGRTRDPEIVRGDLWLLRAPAARVCDRRGDAATCTAQCASLSRSQRVE